jgi:hypothetical protein
MSPSPDQMHEMMEHQKEFADAFLRKMLGVKRPATYDKTASDAEIKEAVREAQMKKLHDVLNLAP